MIEENGRNILCTGLLFELLAAMTREAVRSAYIDGQPQISPGSLAYCRKARQYISSHLDRHMAVADIASHLNVSAGYLSTIFKGVTGQTIVEYINRMKLNYIKELIVNKKMTLKEAGEHVGILDENYLSRLFRKYVGVNAREFKLMQYRDTHSI
jgi:YesN/AraC family two-component response regulator